MSTKRLFIGFPVSPTESLQSAVKKLRIGADKREMEFDWTPVENYHVTLCFLGATPVEKIAEIAAKISKIVDGHAPFDTSLRALGGFPDEHHVRVLWAGVRASRALTQLQQDLAEALDVVEDREYVPHLTLARTRKSRSGKDLISPFVRTAFGEVRIDRIALFESVMHGSRPRYEILESFLLNEVAA